MPKSTSTKKRTNKPKTTLKKSTEPSKKNRTILRKFLPELMIVGVIIGLAFAANNQQQKTAGAVTPNTNSSKVVLGESVTAVSNSQDTTVNDPSTNGQPNASVAAETPIVPKTAAQGVSQTVQTAPAAPPSSTPVPQSNSTGTSSPVPTPIPVVIPPAPTPVPSPGPVPPAQHTTLIGTVNNLVHHTLQHLLGF